MNCFDVYVLVHILRQITQVELFLLWAKMNGFGTSAVDESVNGKAMEAFRLGELLFSNTNLAECLRAVTAAKDRWQKSLLDISSGCEIMHQLGENIIAQLQSLQFLRVSDDRSQFIDAASLFGDEVNSAFPSASADIKEAGNCLAAECNTAAVFHLMRAAEVALRALAADRKVTFANKPLDYQEWGTILGALEGILRDMRLADAKNWTDVRFKEAQIRFYNDAVQEFRAFNETWRRFLSHARADAFCDRQNAASVLDHVRAFMQKLAMRIGETKATPEFWDTE